MINYFVYRAYSIFQLVTVVTCNLKTVGLSLRIYAAIIIISAIGGLI